MKVSVIFMMMFFLVACQHASSTKDVKLSDLKTDDQKAIYSIGGMFGGQVERLGLNEQEMNILLQGFKDVAGKSKPLLDTRAQQANVQAFFKKRMEKVSLQSKKDGKEYIEKFLAQPGVKKTKSGLAYKVVTPGNVKKKPSASDTVEVHYHGTLTDGTVFDSSKERGKTVSFPLNRVIKGWTEGLQLIGEGGKIKLVIPSELGYGDNGAPPKIPGGATLVFDVELVSVKDAKPAPKAQKGTKAKAAKKK